MSARPLPIEPERLSRKVLLSVEVVDAVTQIIVSRGVTVKAKGVESEPILSRSGRFVWLDRGEAWPAEISAVPFNLPYAPSTVAPRPPQNFPNPRPEDRLVRIVLRPTAAYEFVDGVAVVRGQLCERSDAASDPVTDAGVQLAWRDTHEDKWVPAPPATAVDPTTDERGEFAAYLRVAPVGFETPDIAGGLLKARLQFTRAGATRVTPEEFPFLADAAHKGRIPEGSLLERDLRLGWADLIEI